MGPLNGIEVIEFAGIGPAPFACMLLAQMGARVLRISRPNHVVSVGSRATIAGREEIDIDLKSEAGMEAVRQRIAQADVLVEGFRPGVMERLGLGPDACFKLRPSLVYGRMTGWGQDGPMSGMAGHDINYIAVTGALAAIGEPGRKPSPPSNLVGDFGGGALYLAMGIAAALVDARASGRGRVVDAAIVDGTLSMLTGAFGIMAATGNRNERGTSMLNGGTPWYDTYETSDGGYMSLGAIEPHFYRLFCEKAGLEPEWIEAQHDTERWPALRARLEALFRTRTREDWAKCFDGTDACCVPVLTLDEAVQHPHLRARGAFQDRDGHPWPVPAPRFTEAP
ncbi:CoA transferase [Allopusillimonas soli]|uniref:CoA transferase n=1 Tax=Allopusillimonas soli TaxID=659016 RepID=A0A853FCH0_9BURK|nr:CaiB/BaiF CoA-transferase family protein [Allopusillimonas soli]NYT35756.1 CoA transferase [Allopusillimonas soli]TEA76139.1 CoA transferase [Allopusillimonas soli]